MHLSQEPPDLRPGAGQVFRSSGVPELVAALVTLGLLAAGAWGVTRSGGLPWVAWIGLGPMILLGVPLLLTLAVTFFESFAASRRPTNWLACLRRDGLFLNLRSFRNGHFTGSDPTVVFLPLREIAGRRSVVETHTEQGTRREVRGRQRWLELELHAGIDTDELEIACYLERTREAPETVRLGLRSRTKHHDVPVYVPESGRVRVRWHRGLVQALAGRVEERPALEVDLDRSLEDLPVEERAREFLRRGQRMAAVRVLRADGRPLSEASDWVDAEQRRAA